MVTYYEPTSTASANTTSNIIWAGWSDYYDGTSGTTSSIWNVWVDSTAMPSASGTITLYGDASRELKLPVESNIIKPEPKLIQKPRRLIRSPELRAKRLLLEYLNPEQRAQFKKDGTFVVIGNKTGKRYSIRKGRSHNVKEIDREGKAVRSFCAHPRESVPDFDTMLSQKIMLEHMESDFIKIANSWVH